MKRFPTLAARGVATIAVCGVAATAVLAGASGPAGPSGVHITPLAHGTIGSKVRADRGGIEIRTKGPRDMLVTSIRVDPGGSFGWHTHRGPVLVAVSTGTLAVYELHAIPPPAQHRHWRTGLRRGRRGRPPGPQRGLRSGRAQRDLARPHRHQGVPRPPRRSRRAATSERPSGSRKRRCAESARLRVDRPVRPLHALALRRPRRPLSRGCARPPAAPAHFRNGREPGVRHAGRPLSLASARRNCVSEFVNG